MRIVGAAVGVVCLAGCGTSGPTSSSGWGQAPAERPDAWVSVGAPAGSDASPPDGAPAGGDASFLGAAPGPDSSATQGAGCIDAGIDATAADGSVWTDLQGCLVQAPVGPDPAPVPCDVDASFDSGVCPPPSSVCADSNWLVYYDNGSCVAGSCVWQKRSFNCNGRGCLYGSCASYSTTPPLTAQ